MPTPPETAPGTAGQDGPAAEETALTAPAAGPPAAQTATEPALEPETLPVHPLRAVDVPALIPKRIG